MIKFKNELFNTENPDNVNDTELHDVNLDSEKPVIHKPNQSLSMSKIMTNQRCINFTKAYHDAIRRKKIVIQGGKLQFPRILHPVNLSDIKTSYLY